jgi:hypothetical protein
MLFLFNIFSDKKKICWLKDCAKLVYCQIHANGIFARKKRVKLLKINILPFINSLNDNIEMHSSLENDLFFSFFFNV